MAAYAALASLTQTTDLNTNQRKYNFSRDAQEKIKSIYEYVIFLLSFLENFPEKANRWEAEMRDVAHEAEDIIEHFTWNRIHSHLKWANLQSVGLEDQLNSVTEKIGSIAGKVTEERPASVPISISLSSRLASTDTDAVIGLDDDVKAIKERLCGQSSDDLQVISIVGMGGIGKTTLARTIYVNPSIIGHFDIRAWVRVSQDHSPHKLRRILLGLLDSMNLLGEQIPGQEIDDSEIERKVFQNLKFRRYLIVLDDVWSTEVLDDVRNIFPDDGKGSRIMLTTRYSNVAAYPDPASPLHEMQFMNENQSWELLKKRVFTNSHCPHDLEVVGKVISRSCAGLPLVVVLVAGFLTAVDQTPAAWGEIAKNVNAIVDKDVKKILSLSYNHLPHHLRPCFLYIGCMPEHANIRASGLTKLWVAEGFVKHQRECSKSLEEQAEEHLEDLVKRNLVVVTSRKSNGKIKSCNLHDMVRDLCIRKAHEEKFLLVMDGHGSDLPEVMMKARRISSSRADVHKFWGPVIRTVLYFQLQNIPSWSSFLRSSRLLRVLNAVDNNDKELPSQVFELFHLRYLALMCSLNIPSAISNLVNLQTLIIYPTFPRRKRYWRYDKNASHFYLPLEIWKMPQLRHLILNAPYKLPHSLDESNLPLENLQTLSPLENLVWNKKIPQKIPNIKRLGLVYTVNQEYHLDHLKDLTQLEKLEINGYRDFSWLGQNPTFPWALKKLTLVGGGFPWQDMAIIGSLPNLQVLKLLDYACHGEKWITADEEFCSLNFLEIDGSHLRHWETESSHFPRLKCLVLRSCRGLSKIPDGIGEIPTLELIEVDNCEKSVVESAKEIKEEQESYDNYDLQVRCGGSVEGKEKGGDGLSVSTSYPVPVPSPGVGKYVDDRLHQIVELDWHIAGLQRHLQGLIADRAALQGLIADRAALQRVRFAQRGWRKWLFAKGRALARATRDWKTRLIIVLVLVMISTTSSIIISLTKRIRR